MYKRQVAGRTMDEGSTKEVKNEEQPYIRHFVECRKQGPLGPIDVKSLR